MVPGAEVLLGRDLNLDHMSAEMDDEEGAPLQWRTADDGVRTHFEDFAMLRDLSASLRDNES